MSSILQVDNPLKFHDPDVPTITCHIGDHKIERELLDLGFSINLIPYSILLKLGLGELKPSKFFLLLADKSVRTPWGKIDDVLFCIDKDYFPVSFMILETDPIHMSRKISAFLGIFSPSYRQCHYVRNKK